eukprot:5094902-Heterocapsa_arctica.AAC.1
MASWRFRSKARMPSGECDKVPTFNSKGLEKSVLAHSVLPDRLGPKTTRIGYLKTSFAKHAFHAVAAGTSGKGSKKPGVDLIHLALVSNSAWAASCSSLSLQ